MTEASKQISWIWNLLSEMRFNIKSIPLLVDNQGAMFLASNPAQEGHTKHIEIPEHFPLGMTLNLSVLVQMVLSHTFHYG